MVPMANWITYIVCISAGEICWIDYQMLASNVTTQDHCATKVHLGEMKKWKEKRTKDRTLWYTCENGGRHRGM